MRVVRLMDEPDWQSRLPSIEEIFFATSPSAKTLRPDERQPFKARWLGRYMAYDIESFFVAITEVTGLAPGFPISRIAMQPIPAVIDGNTASALGIEAHGSRSASGRQAKR